jgi:sugar phosphate isomerase/epimerase
LTTEPPKLVEVAAKAGFDFVGIRVRPVTTQETPFDVQPGSVILAETLARLADTEVEVKDTEFLLINGSDQREAWLQMFEAGQALGAESMTVAVADTDPSRVVDTLGQMAADGKAYGITPALEPISYQAVNSYPQAAKLAEQTGVTVLVDTLHAARFGATTQDLRAVATLVPMIQLCDAASLQPQTRESLIEESRSRRFPAGEGGQDLAGMIAAVDAGRGDPASLLPISVETPNIELQDAMSTQEWVNRLYHTTRALVDSIEPVARQV